LEIFLFCCLDIVINLACFHQETFSYAVTVESKFLAQQNKILVTTVNIDTG
jgi:hypothetical protein